MVQTYRKASFEVTHNDDHINIQLLYILQVKDQTSVSGNDAKTCPFYDEIDRILGKTAASSPSVLLESGGKSGIVSITDLDQDVGVLVMYIHGYNYALISLLCSWRALPSYLRGIQ